MRVFLHAGLVATATYFAVIMYAIAIQYRCASVARTVVVTMGHNKDDFNNVGSGYPAWRGERRKPVNEYNSRFY